MLLVSINYKVNLSAIRITKIFEDIFLTAQRYTR